jgi:hypothetical protein
MENCEVGMFKLPGLRFEKGQLPPELVEEMTAWAKENHCGMIMHDWLWSFKNEAQRDWFILRWSDVIPKPKVEDDPS